MARLSLGARKLIRRKKYLASLLFWLNITHLVNLFYLIVLNVIEKHKSVNSRVGLRVMYEYNFFARREYVEKLVYKSDTDCIEQLRMNRMAFQNLCALLQTSGGLTHTKNMLIDEQVSLTLYILAHHHKNRVIRFNFTRSKETVSRHFRSVINAIIRLHKLLLKKPQPISPHSTDERWKWFQGCLGALDGTYIKVQVPAGDRPRYRTRKGEIATNVLGVCSPDMQFIYVLLGWEGSAADGRVLRDAISRRNGLVVPVDCYYLVDGGYTNCEGFLAPFRGQRYHLSDWRVGQQPNTSEEFFNMKHSSARNVIERCFGMLKARWGIFRGTMSYPIAMQTRIILACCLLHNFIREEMKDDPMENEPIENQNNVEQGDEDRETITSIGTSNEWTQYRATLATNMFNTWRMAN